MRMYIRAWMGGSGAALVFFITLAAPAHNQKLAAVSISFSSDRARRSLLRGAQGGEACLRGLGILVRGGALTLALEQDAIGLLACLVFSFSSLLGAVWVFSCRTGLVAGP